MRRLVLYAALLIAAPRPARAELWASSMGQLMKDAKRIEILDVTAVKDGRVTGTLAVAVRSPDKLGAKLVYDLGYLNPPAAGDRLLVVCDYQCPRAIGVERDGAFQVIAQEPMDGAFVTPNVVETRALQLLSEGKPAPNLCIRGIVELLDEPARPGFEVKLDPANGSGGGTIAGHKVNATMTAVWFASETGAIEIRLSGKGSVELVAAHVGREKDGCYSSTFLPSKPVLRTAKSLDRALDGIVQPHVIAKGTLTAPKGAPIAAGAHTITFSVSSDGYLEIDSDLAKGRVGHVQHLEKSYGVGFDTPAGPSAQKELLFEFPIPLLNGYEHGAAVAKAVRSNASPAVFWVEGAKKTPLGTVTLTYVREKLATIKPTAR